MDALSRAVVDAAGMRMIHVLLAVVALALLGAHHFASPDDFAIFML